MKPGYLLAAGGWISGLALSWLMILERVKMWPAALFLVFFYAIAVFVSMTLYGGGKSNGTDSKV